jgi:phosphatidylglycerophosphatase A
MDFLIKNLSTLGPIGTKLPAPGTFGSLAGLMAFSICVWLSPLSPTSVVSLFSALFIVGIPLCSRAEVLLAKPDPPEVIWDEFTAIPLVYIFCLEELSSSSFNSSIFLLLLGFILFRIFDILKPLGIRGLQKLPSGWGVMIDDLAAALISGGVLYLIQTFPLSF